MEATENWPQYLLEIKDLYGWSWNKLAKLAGVGRGTLGYWLKGKTRPTRPMLVRVRVELEAQPLPKIRQVTSTQKVTAADLAAFKKRWTL